MTTNNKELLKKIREWTAICVSVIAILSAIGLYGKAQRKQAILEYKVEQVVQLTTEYNIPVMDNKIDNLTEKMDEVNGKIDLALGMMQNLVNNQ